MKAYKLKSNFSFKKYQLVKKFSIDLLKSKSFKFANTNPIFELTSEDKKNLETQLKNLNLNEEEKLFIKKTYFSGIGLETYHLENNSEREFINSQLEFHYEKDVSKTEMTNFISLLCGCEKFEKLLTTKFPTFKRYSGEGLNSLIPLLQTILSMYSNKNSEILDVVVSMGHRCRLNVLSMIFDYPVKNILYKINDGRDIPQDIPGLCDIVTHLASTREKQYTIDGNISNSKNIKVSMLNNPSHLEMNYPLGLGKSVAKRNDYYQEFSNNDLEDLNNKNDKVAYIAIHGDAAVSGQGVIYETLAMVNKENMVGTIHIIANNQIGFTTEKTWSKPSDVFKGFDYPILHVNSNDYKSIIISGKIAVEYRNKFKKDIVINLIGWRKYGHNEVDDPTFTQPHMYSLIKNKPSYYDEIKTLLSDKTINNIEKAFDTHLEKEFNQMKDYIPDSKMTRDPNFLGSRSLTHKWKDINFPHLSKYVKNGDTVLSKEKVVEYIKSSVDIPKTLNIHQRLKNFYVKSRIESINKNEIDFPTGEISAFASLLDEGFNIRISGQDVMRGTFSQRHCGLVDQTNNNIFYPLEKYFNKVKKEGRFEVNNSILSELGVMLYEFGYSMENPKNLVLWEAQFGDFSNVAQLVFDQYISTSEAKWLRQSAFTVLLPHGFDGAGPEHSTSRIERILQNVNNQGHSSNIPDCRNLNFQVVQPTTSANYFHFLRRQMKRDYRKPLVVITPKIGLRHSSYNSKLEDFESEYKPIIVSNHGNKIQKVYFTSGQSFLNFEGLKQENICLIRIEELAPFPILEIKNYLKEILKVSKSTQFYYFQEESLNSGTFYYSFPYLSKILKDLNLETEINYIGREAQETANGCVKDHKNEVKKLKDDLAKSLHH